MGWKEKIKPGYLYQIGREPGAITGCDGAREYGELLEKAGMPDALIQFDIAATETDGIRTDTVFYPLAAITWTKIQAP